MKTKIQILSLSASKKSVSRSCIPIIKNAFEHAGVQLGISNVCDLPPVWVDDRELENYPKEYQELFDVVDNSHGIVMMLPIYCYSMSSPAKAITEIIGDALERKPTGFIVAAGSPRSYLAVGDMMCSMMFEQETLCFPKQVMAHESDLDKVGTPCPELQTRLVEFVGNFLDFVKANMQ